MQYITVMPNFTIVAEKNKSFSKHYDVLNTFCEKVSSVEHTSTYKITPESFWRGLNLTQSPDDKLNFVNFLMKFSIDNVPENVITELKSFKEKFGKVLFVGDDCLVIKDPSLLKEVKNSSTIEPYISESFGNVIFFKDISLNKLEEIFLNEFNYPIKFHMTNINTYVFWDGQRRYAVKSNSEVNALLSFYNVHPFICEQDLRLKLNIPKRDIEQSDIVEYVEYLIENPEDAACKIDIREVPKFSSTKPVFF